MKPLGMVKITWSPEFAYAIGLLTTDGSLSKDGRHITFVSKDQEMMENLQKCLKIKCNIGKKSSGSNKQKIYNVIHIGDVKFYNFLISIGLMPRKSKVVGALDIPKKYFFDFLRGHFDGDGTFFSYLDPRWKSSFMFYTVFISASPSHIEWLQNKISDILKIDGHIVKSGAVYQLKYAKKESLKLLPKLYGGHSIYLSRKKIKIEAAIKKAIKFNRDARVVKWYTRTLEVRMP